MTVLTDELREVLTQAAEDFDVGAREPELVKAAFLYAGVRNVAVALRNDGRY